MQTGPKRKLVCFTMDNVLDRDILIPDKETVLCALVMHGFPSLVHTAVDPGQQRIH